MPRYNVHPGIAVEKLKQGGLDSIVRMFQACKDPRQRAFFSLLYISGARIHEVTSLRKDNIKLDGDYLKIRFITLKVARGKFKPPYRNFKYRYRSALNKSPPHIYYKAILDYVSLLSNPDTKLFTITDRTGENWISRITKSVLGVALYPHAFRHYLVTVRAEKGDSVTSLMSLKGTTNLKAVQDYLQLREFEVTID